MLDDCGAANIEAASAAATRHRCSCCCCVLLCGLAAACVATKGWRPPRFFFWGVKQLLLRAERRVFALSIARASERALLEKKSLAAREKRKRKK